MPKYDDWSTLTNPADRQAAEHLTWLLSGGTPPQYDLRKWNNIVNKILENNYFREAMRLIISEAEARSGEYPEISPRIDLGDLNSNLLCYRTGGEIKFVITDAFASAGPLDRNDIAKLQILRERVGLLPKHNFSEALSLPSRTSVTLPVVPPRPM